MQGSYRDDESDSDSEASGNCDGDKKRGRGEDQKGLSQKEEDEGEDSFVYNPSVEVVDGDADVETCVDILGELVDNMALDEREGARVTRTDCKSTENGEAEGSHEGNIVNNVQASPRSSRGNDSRSRDRRLGCALRARVGSRARCWWGQ